MIEYSHGPENMSIQLRLLPFLTTGSLESGTPRAPTSMLPGLCACDLGVAALAALSSFGMLASQVSKSGCDAIVELEGLLAAAFVADFLSPLRPIDNECRQLRCFDSLVTGAGCASTAFGCREGLISKLDTDVLEPAT